MPVMGRFSLGRAEPIPCCPPPCFSHPNVDACAVNQIVGHNLLYVRLSDPPSLAPIPRSNQAFLRVRAVIPLVLAGPLPVVNCGGSVRGFPSHNKPLDVYGITVHTGIVKG